MKRVLVFIISVTLLLNLAACVSKPTTIEGYWMAENGDTISFTADGRAIINGLSLTYSIYDGNNLSISVLGLAEEYRFDLQNDVLTLTDLSNNNFTIYYKDEDKQAEIQKHLQELEAFTQAQEAYDKQIQSLNDRIVTIDKEITWLYNFISDNEEYIADNEEYIQEEHNTIAELENAICELQDSTDILAQGEIDILRVQQQICYGIIDMYSNQITTYTQQINQYKQDIAAFEAEKETIIKQLKGLGAY